MCMRRFGQASGEPWCARRVSARIRVSPTEEAELGQAFRISRPQRAESFPSGPAGGLPSGSRLEKAKKEVGYHTTDRRGRSRAGNRSSFAGISTGAGRSRGTPRSVFPDRKSTRLNSSHGYISYAVFCLKKKKTNRLPHTNLTPSRANRTPATLVPH